MKMNPKTNVVICCAAVVFTMVGCLKKPTAIDITEKEKIALVSFALDKTISYEGSSEVDNGPGMLQKAVKGKEKGEADYFEHHQKVVDALLKEYNSQITSSMLNVPFVDFTVIKENNSYQDLTKHIPKIVMGTDINPGASFIVPEGINYISEYDSDKLDLVADAIGTTTLLLVKHKVDFEKAEALIEIKTSRMSLTTDLTLYEKGEGIISSWTFKARSEKGISLILGTPNPKDFEEAVLSANEDIMQGIKEYYTNQKSKKEQLAANQSAE